MIKNVIFDVDGTLVDSNRQHARAWQKAFAEYGKEIEFDQLLTQIGKGGDQLMPEFLSSAEMAEFGEKLEKYRNKLFEKDYLPHLKPFPKVRELMEKIKRNGGRAVLASSSTGKQVAAYKKLLNIADLLDEETSADDAEVSKPAPDIFLAALEKIGSPAKENCVVIGDTPYDAISAKKAGLKIIGVTCGGWSESVLREAGCAEVYTNPADLLEKFDNSCLAQMTRE